jgi:hypothetical protein
MSDEEESKKEVLERAFAGLKDHLVKKKNSAEVLKKGGTSGISQVFGNASTLLPAEYLDEFLKGVGFEFGEALLGTTDDPAAYQKIFERVSALFAGNGQDVFEEDSQDPSDEREVLAVFMDEGKRKILYVDGSVEDFPEPNPADSASEGEIAEEQLRNLVESFSERAFESVEQPTYAGEHLTDCGDSVSEADGPAREIEAEDEQPLPTPAFEERDEQPEVPLEPPSLRAASAEHFVRKQPPAVLEEQILPERLPTLPQQQVMPELTPAVLRAPQEASEQANAPGRSNGKEPDLRVLAPDGRWLWDIFYSDNQLSQVITADGTVLQSPAKGWYVMVDPLRAGERVPQVELIRSAVCDPGSGNLAFENIGNTRSTTFLSNGWRIDEYRDSGSQSKTFVTEIGASTFAAGPMEVVNLRMDMATGDVSFSAMDGLMTIILRRRRLK